jgi:glutamyl-tRNA synthetase
MSIKTRIAPTPSGFLHVGNLYNFCITYVLAKANNGIIYLRIDDADSERMRIEYLDDIFYVNEWLGLQCDEGPGSVSDFLRNYSQAFRANQYQQIIDQLALKKLVFACECSRAQLAKGNHSELCNTETQTSIDVALRMKIANETNVQIKDLYHSEITIPVPCFPEPVVRKKNGFASYNIGSLSDDMHDGINLIVRGEDLLSQTALQCHISQAIGVEKFSNINFLHHPLLTDERGKKLSKSAGAQASSIVGDKAAKQFVLNKTADFLGLSIEPVSLAQLANIYIETTHHDKRHIVLQ